jgi:hypothetical protein
MLAVNEQMSWMKKTAKYGKVESILTKWFQHNWILYLPTLLIKCMFFNVHECIKITIDRGNSLLYNGYRVFPGGKAAGAWC